MCEKYDYMLKVENAEEDIKSMVKAIQENCPKKILKRSKSLAKEYYRFKRNERDDYPYFLSSPNIFRRRGSKEIERCKMCGLSVFEDLEDLLNTIKKFKYLPPVVYVIRAEAIKIRKVGEIYHTPSPETVLRIELSSRVQTTTQKMFGKFIEK